MDNEMEIPWDFVQKYYPNYAHSDEIAEEEDLYKLITGEYEVGDCADNVLQSQYGGDIKSAKIYEDWTECLNQIYEKSIQGYIDQLNDKHNG